MTIIRATHPAILMNRTAHMPWLMSILGALILSLAGQISIPLEPVPLTFQSATVILLGLALGMKSAVRSVALYLCAGFMGLPVFAEFSGGLHLLWAPTTGYLFGFLPAAALAGWLAERGAARRVWSLYLVAILSAFVIFACGASFLQTFVGGWKQAFMLGVAPFALTECAKLVFVAASAKLFWKS